FSMGGAFAFELYCRFPNKIAALILISTGAILPVSDVVFEYLRKDYTMFCNFLVKFLYSKNADETIKKLSNEELLSLNPEILENDFKICSKVDYRNILKDIRIPVLIIANRDDKMVPLKYAEELANEISHSQLVIFETDGHMPHVENAKSTAEAIKEFYLHELD
ncbi:MAG: alpha/beta hydrolase, partial [Spirochaetes bacterium]|nr:alpha/beta hydrolase [Spirochaetota bacterium]